MHKTIKVLLIEDEPETAVLTQRMLAEYSNDSFIVEWVDKLQTGLKRLAEDDIDVILLDLGLPDSFGLETCIKIQAQAPSVPIVVLSGLADETIAAQTIQAGAQDYVLKSKTNADLLVRTIRYSIERKRTEEALQKAYDELEQRVEERTAELAKTNTKLRQEIAERKRTEVENERLHKEMQRRAQELATLNKAGQTMTSTLELDTVLEQVMAEAQTMVNAEGAAVLLHDSINDELIFAAVASPGAEIMTGTRVPLTSSIAGWVVSEKQPVLVEDAQQDSRFYSHVDAITGLTTRSMVAVPLIVREEVIGVIEATNKAQGTFTKYDLELLGALASSAAIAIENARLFEQVQAGREQLRQLAQKVVAAQEEERQRLSYELHDDAGQVLTALKIGLNLIRADLPEEAETLHKRMGEALSMTDMTMERLRALARELRPPALDAAGLNPTLEGLCRDFAGWTQLSIEYSGTDPKTLPDPVKIYLYRFLQEALTNVAKHAQANQVWVKLEATDRLVSLRVQDDGRGFDKQVSLGAGGQTKGIGLLGMQERLALLGGWLEIEGRPGQGAILVAYIPVGVY